MELITTARLSVQDYEELRRKALTLTMANGSKVRVEVESNGADVDGKALGQKETAPRRRTQPISGGKIKCFFCPRDDFKYYGNRSQHAQKEHPKEWEERQAQKKSRRR